MFVPSILVVASNQGPDIILSHTGYHKVDVPKQTIAQQVLALKWSFAVQMFYHPMMGAIRASIILFLFRVRDKRMHIRIALHVVCMCHRFQPPLVSY